MEKKWQIGKSINNVEEFKEFCKGVSREEFERDCLKIDSDHKDYSCVINGEWINCPSSVGLKDDDNNGCMYFKQCWMESVEDIYFKDDIDKSKLVKISDNENIVKTNTYNNIKVEKDYNKEYSLQEVLDLPIETKILGTGTNQSYTIKEVGTKNNAVWIDSKNEFAPVCSGWLNAKFKLISIEKEVMFEEVLNYNGKCRIEHVLMEQFKTYDNLQTILLYMCKYHNNIEVKEIIKNGTWFIKREENN
jgi:hypothetical protein